MKIVFALFIVFFSNSVFSQFVVDVDTSKGIKVFPINQLKPQLQDSILKATVTNGYWSWEVAPKPEITDINMQKAKVIFKAEHPEIFAKIACDQNGLVFISYLEFSNSSPEKKAFFLSNPDLYKILPK